MARPRKALIAKVEGTQHVCYYWHPLKKRTLRVVLGDDSVFRKNLDYLNDIALHPEKWRNPPPGASCVRDSWLMPESLTKSSGASVKKGGKKLTADEIAKIISERDALAGERPGLLAEIDRLKKEVKFLLGKKAKQNGPQPALQDAFDAWFKEFKGTGDKKDHDHVNGVKWDVERFIRKFGGTTTLDQLEGREKEIDIWISGLTTGDSMQRTYTQRKERKRDRKNKNPEMVEVIKEFKPDREARQLSAGRRRHIRLYVLKFLRESGVELDGSKISTPEKTTSVIHWLEKGDAEKLAGKLPSYWKDMFRVQVGIGLRPDELPTLKKTDFSADYSRLTLSEAEHLTLKLGSREIFVPEAVREIIKRRLATSAFAFPNPTSGALWQNAKWFDRSYLKELRKAGAAAKLTTPIDCRTGRRTCASILLRSGHSTEKVGALLGDNPDTIRKHYARILPHEVDPSAAAI